VERRSNLWLVSGPPGIGKSTLVSKVIFNLRSRGIIVGGCVTAEKRVKQQRVGFRLKDLLTGEEGELASVEGGLGPRIGKYRVNLNTLSSIGVKAMVDATEQAELIVIDEVGPMELTSPEFRRALKVSIASMKPILAVVHERLNDPLLLELRAICEGGVLTVGLANRDALANEVTRRIASQLKTGVTQ